jgi:hypothetical protein
MNDDVCDLCGRTGVAVSRTTLDGRTACDDCQGAADEIDEDIRNAEALAKASQGVGCA